MSKIEYESENNVYASRVNGSVIHISEAESGRNGYFCLGCGGIMQAKKGKIMAHHFSHEPKDVTRIGKCTYSDETHRHKLAKEILQRIKQVKVPAIYKFPPKGIEGAAFKLRESHTISAFQVENELYFYENELGDVAYDKGINWHEDENKLLLIKPDVTFFNEEGKPILLIEVVATHKLNDDKKTKIRRLGIDTIQVLIPKDSPSEIEQTFYKTDRTKWIYNNEQSKSEYLRVSNITAEGVSSVDELQREFFEESFKCRATQIGNLIRTIKKCLDSEQYSKIKLRLGEEVLRVEGNTKRNRERLGRIQEHLQSEIDGQFIASMEEIKAEEANIALEERELREYQAEIEGKYNTETARLDSEEKCYRARSQDEIDTVEKGLAKFGTKSRSIVGRRNEIIAEERFIQSEEERLGFNIISETERIRRNCRRTQEEIDRVSIRREGLFDKYREIEDGIRIEFEKRKRELRKQFEEQERSTIEVIKNRDIQSLPQLSGRIKEIVDSGRLLESLTEEINCIKRLRRAKEIFDSKSYKNWI